MPNNVENVITLKGSEEEIKKLMKEIKSDEEDINLIDFNKIIPMPKSLMIEESSSMRKGLKHYQEFLKDNNLEDIDLLNKEAKYLEENKSVDKETFKLGKKAFLNIQNYGYATWYDWSIKNWGTKWNAYGCHDKLDSSNMDTICFQTAWSAPHEILKRLSEMYPNIEITHQWADEDLGSNCGRKTYYKGTCIEEYYPMTEKEAMEFAFKVWDYDPAELGLSLNSAETKYIDIENRYYDLIEIFNRPALFSEYRLNENGVPKGLYCYYLRADEENVFATIEPEVTVNFSGTVITDEPVDFKGNDHIEFTDETSPNFTDEQISFRQYMDKSFLNEQIQNGGMQL